VRLRWTLSRDTDEPSFFSLFFENRRLYTTSTLNAFVMRSRGSPSIKRLKPGKQEPQFVPHLRSRFSASNACSAEPRTPQGCFQSPTRVR